MKKSVFFLFILLIVAFSGCTARESAPAPTPEPTLAPTPTPAPTPEPTIAPVTVCGVTAAWDAEELDLSGAAADAAALAAALPALPELSRVDLTGWALTRAEQLALRAAAPDVHFVWTVEVEGVACSSEEAFLDLSGVAVDVAALEEALPLLPALTKVDMVSCGQTDEAMYELNERWDDVQFVWVTKLGKTRLRTDVTYYRASDAKMVKCQMTDALLDEQLRYFPELVALDVGHSSGYITRCDWVRYTPKLQVLILACCRVTDLTPLAQLSELSYLEIFSNKGLVDIAPLAGCAALQDLNLSYLKFPDLSPVYGLEKLGRLWLVSCKSFPAEQAEKFRAAHPDCELVFEENKNGATAYGWRETERYEWMRNLFNAPYMVG